MSNIPRSPNGQFARQPLNQLRILASLLRPPSWTSHKSESNAAAVIPLPLSTSMISRTKSSTMTKKRRFDLRIWMAKR
ncbi:hypothetical protein KEM48_012846 [Puccinia striiformis f. sp. tritici PST-130]|nr:hypothetical protein KEM48_012846 [Puccinia striiformis f. sp. tritici PST-130]